MRCKSLGLAGSQNTLNFWPRRGGGACLGRSSCRVISYALPTGGVTSRVHPDEPIAKRRKRELLGMKNSGAASAVLAPRSRLCRQRQACHHGDRDNAEFHCVSPVGTCVRCPRATIAHGDCWRGKLKSRLLAFVTRVPYNRRIKRSRFTSSAARLPPKRLVKIFLQQNRPILDSGEFASGAETASRSRAQGFKGARRVRKAI
jgi:hypothetical protein